MKGNVINMEDWRQTREAAAKKISPSDLWLMPDSVIAAMANDTVTTPTGWPPLDRQLRNGGVPPGRVIVIGGPPFAGKTTVVASILLDMSRSMPCFALFSDEGRSQASVRMGVMLGIPLPDLDKDPQRSSERVKEMLGEQSIHLLKPDTEFSYAEEAVRFALAHRLDNEACLIVLDSVQTIISRRPVPGFELDSPRLELKRLMTDCHNWAEEHRMIFLLTSQANRAFYRSKKLDENINAIAGFSEGSSIEFTGDVTVMLSLPNEDTGTVHARIPKNRLKGSAKPFDVRYDPVTGRMLEIDQATSESESAEQNRARLKGAKQKIVDLLKRHHNGMRSPALAELSSCRRADFLDALRALVAEKIVFVELEGRSAVYKLEG